MKDQLRDCLNKLDIHNSMRPDGMHPQVLRKLADLWATLISERSYWLGKVPGDWKEENVTSVFKKGKEEPNKPEIPSSVSENVMK